MELLSLVGVVVVWLGVMAYVVSESEPAPVESRLTFVLGNY